MSSLAASARESASFAEGFIHAGMPRERGGVAGAHRGKHEARIRQQRIRSVSKVRSRPGARHACSLSISPECSKSQSSVILKLSDKKIPRLGIVIIANSNADGYYTKNSLAGDFQDEGAVRAQRFCSILEG